MSEHEYPIYNSDYSDNDEWLDGAIEIIKPSFLYTIDDEWSDMWFSELREHRHKRDV